MYVLEQPTVDTYSAASNWLKVGLTPLLMKLCGHANIFFM